jgi:hypothetical protein
LDRIEILNISDRILKDFLQHIPEEKIAEYGEKNGLSDSLIFFNSMGYPINYQTFKFLVLEYFGNQKCSKWFTCFYHNLDTRDIFHLQHSFGRKWSVFIDNYLRTILNKIAINRTESKIYEYAVTLKISKVKI